MTGFRPFTGHRLWSTVLSGLLILLLSGCQTTKFGVPESDNQLDAGQSHAPPNVQLSKDLLEQLMTAEIAVRRGGYDQAVSQLLSAATQSRDPRLASKAAYWALQSGLYKQARQASELWLEILKDQPESNRTQAKIILASSLLELSHPDQALGLYRQVTQESKDEDIYKHIASEMSRLKNSEGMVDVYLKLIDKADNEQSANLGLAILSARLNDFEQSRSAVEKVLQLNPEHEEAALIKLSYLFEDQVDQEIVSFAESFLKKKSKADRFRLEYARYLSGQNQAQKAIKLLKKVSQNDEQFYQDASLNIIALAMQQQEFNLADKRLKKLLEIDPTDFRLTFYRCQVQRELANYTLASELCNEISFGQFYFPAQLELADIQANQGNIDRALKHLDLLPVAGIDEQIRVYLRKQQILYEADELERSLVVLTDGLSKYPDDTSLLYARGLVLSELGKVQEHERDMRKLIKLDPENPHAYNALGYTLADLTTRYDEALGLIQKAIELNPDDAYILDSLGWVYFKLNNYDQAKVYLEQAFDLSGDAEIAAHLGELYWVLGDKNRAKSVWRKAKKQTPDNKVLNRTLERFL